MAAPYEPGDRVAFLEPDVDGLRVREGIVYGTEGSRVGVLISRGPESELHWIEVDDHGFALDRTARSQLVPMDQQISDSLAQHGDGYVVRPSETDIYDIAENQDEVRAQLEARIEQAQAPDEHHGYGYLCCASRNLRVTTAAVA
ncbi:MAG: hypothetical protein WAL41_20730 [Mycobacterium sp.]